MMRTVPTAKLATAALATALLCAGTATAAPGDTLFSDDFDDGSLAPWSESGGPGDAGVNADTSQSGSSSMFLRWDPVTVTSPVIDASAAQVVDVSMWIRRGDDSFSELPDFNEDLRLQYLDDTGSWQTINTWPGSGTGGEVFTPTFSLPSDSAHSNLRFRFQMLGGSGPDFDYWHIDDFLAIEGAPPISANLLTEYRMEDGAWDGSPGEVVDETGNGHDGTTTGGTTRDPTDPAISGDPGTCDSATFDGSDDGIDDPDAGNYLNGLSGFTFAAWVKNTDSLSGNNRGIFFTDDPSPGKDHRIGIRFDSSGANGGGSNLVKAGIQTTACNDGNDCVQVETQSNVTSQGAWQHVAMTWVSGGDLRVYVDGQDVTGDGTGDIGQGTGGVIDAVDGLRLGQGGKGQRWQGNIDEVRIYDDALTGPQIQGLMIQTHPCPFCAPDADFSDSFEDGSINPWQRQGGPPSRVGVSSATSGDGGSSMFLRHDSVRVQSPQIDLSAASSADLSIWVQRGDDSFSEDPDFGEDLELQYRNSSNNWVTLQTFTGAGAPGEIFQPSFALPADALHNGFRVRLEFLRGSGSDFDYWHVDNVCVTSVVAGALDHYAIGHDGTAVTCGEEAITITGHDASDGPVDPGNVSVTLDTSTGEGTWARVLAGSGTLSDATAGDGAASYTFPGNGETSVTLAFNYTTVTAATDPETVNFNVDGGNEGAGEDPDLVVSRSGFRFTDGSGNALTIPEQIAGKPSDTDPGAISLALQAIRSSDADPSVCEPYFPDGGDVDVELGAECDDPSSCAGEQVSVTNNGNTSLLPTSNDNGGAGAANYAPVTLRFGPNAEAPLVLAYDDVGQMQLHARYNPIDDGSGTPPVVDYVVGASNAYVVRPFGFDVAVAGDDNTTGAGGTILAVAGDDVDTTVRSVVWASADDSDNDGVPDSGADLSNNAATPNFGNEATPETVTLAPTVDTPAGGSDGSLSAPTFSSFSGGSETHGVSWSEVGHVHIDANLTDGSYLGGSDATGRAATVGRFVPADFDVSVATAGDLDATCAATFTYTGQSFGYVGNMGPELTITARNRSTGTTSNYRGTYAKLTAGDVSVAAPVEDADQLGADGTNNVSVSATIRVGSRVINNDGTVTYEFDDGNADGDLEADVFTYDKNANARIDGFAPDLDLDVTAVQDSDGVAAAPGVLPLAVRPNATHEIRFGRLTVEAASGSELAPIDQAVRAEIWSNGTWQTHAADDCTSLALASEVQLDNGATTVAGDQSIAVGGGTTDLATNTADPVVLAGGQGVLTFAAPGAGNTGFVDTTLTLGSSLTWLRGDWDDTDGLDDGPFDDNPQGRVTFGIYSGNTNWMFFK